jgi:hypothetical protein
VTDVTDLSAKAKGYLIATRQRGGARLPRGSSVVRRLLLDGLIRWDESDESYRATEHGIVIRAGLMLAKATP